MTNVSGSTPHTPIGRLCLNCVFSIRSRSVDPRAHTPSCRWLAIASKRLRFGHPPPKLLDKWPWLSHYTLATLRDPFEGIGVSFIARPRPLELPRVTMTLHHIGTNPISGVAESAQVMFPLKGISHPAHLCPELPSLKPSRMSHIPDGFSL